MSFNIFDFCNNRIVVFMLAVFKSSIKVVGTRVFNVFYARMAELVDVLASGASSENCGSSNLLSRTIGKLVELIDLKYMKG